MRRRIKEVCRRHLALLLVVTLVLGTLVAMPVTVGADEPTYTHAVSVFAVDSASVGTPAFSGNYRRDGMTVFVRSDHGGPSGAPGATEMGGNAAHGYVRFDLNSRGINPANVQSVTLGLTTNAAGTVSAPGAFGNTAPIPGQLNVIGAYSTAWDAATITRATAPVTAGVAGGAPLVFPRAGISLIETIQLTAAFPMAVNVDVTDFVQGRLAASAFDFSFAFIVPPQADPGNESGFGTGWHSVNTHFHFAGYRVAGGTAPRLYVELDGLTAVQVVGFATNAASMQSALETIGAMDEVTGWDVISSEIGMIHAVMADMLSRTFTNRADIIAQFQDAIDAEIDAGLVFALVRAANAATLASEMRPVLENPALGLDLTIYNGLSEGLKDFVAQAMVNNRPANGFRNAAAIAAVFNQIVAQADAGGDLRLLAMNGTGGIRVIEMNVSGPGGVSIKDASGNTILSHTFAAAAEEHMIAYINLPVGTYTLYVDDVLVGRDLPFVNNAANMIGGIYIIPGTQVSGIHLVENVLIADGPLRNYDLQSTNTRDHSPAFIVLYDIITPAETGQDSLISIGDRAAFAGGIVDWPHTQFLVRAGSGATFFNTFDCIAAGGGGWIMTPGRNQVPIVAHEVFHTQMEIDLVDFYYNVWMAQSGYAETRFMGHRGDDDPLRVRNRHEVMNAGHWRTINELGVATVAMSAGVPTRFENLLVLPAGLVHDALADFNVSLGGTNADIQAALDIIALGVNQEQFARVTDPGLRDDILDAMQLAGPFDTVIGIKSALNRYVTSIGAAGTPTWQTDGNLTVNMTALQQALLSWEEATDGFGIRGYHIERQSAGGAWARIATVMGVGNTSFADSDITANTSYSYRVIAFNYGDNESVPSNVVTEISGNAENFPHDRYVLDDAFRVEPVRFHSRWNNVGVFPAGPQPPHPTGGPPLWMQTEWYNPDNRMAEAMRYLTLIASNPDFHSFVGPDGQTTLLERAIQHFQSMLAGGNEPGVSGTGLAAHGYMPALTALTYAKLNVPEIWNALTAEEIERADLLMKGALFAIYYAAADTGADRGLNQDSNYRRGWNVNHRMGILAVPLIYYYFRAETSGFVGGDFFLPSANTGTIGWMNNFIRDFNYTVFTRQLQETGMTMLYNTFQNAGLVEVHRVAAQIRPEGMTYNLGNTRFHGPLSARLCNSEGIGRWAMLYLNEAFTAGPAVPTPGDLWRTGGTGDLFGARPGLNGSMGGSGGNMPFQRWPGEYRYPILRVANQQPETPLARPGVITTYGFPHGYWSAFREGPGDNGVPLMQQPLWQYMGVYAMNHFPNLGAPGMGQEFEATDASGVRTCIPYVVEGIFGGLDGLLALTRVSDNLGGLTPDVFNDIIVRSNVGWVDLRFRIDNEFLSFCHGRQCAQHASSTRYMTGVGARMNMDLWYNMINNPLDEMAAVNNASSISDMRTALEAPSLALILHAYNGLNEESKNNVAEAMLEAGPFATKAALQTPFSLEVTEQAIRELNLATTPQEMQNALEGPALGLWLFGWNQVTPLIPGITDPAERLVYAGQVLQIMNSETHELRGPWTTRQEIRFALATVLYEPVDLLAYVNAAGDAEDIDLMRDAIEGLRDVLNLARYDMLTAEMQDDVLQYVIDYIQTNGHFTEVEHLQEVIDRVAAEFITEYVRPVYQDAFIWQEAWPAGNDVSQSPLEPNFLRAREHDLPINNRAVLLQFNLQDFDFDPYDIGMVELELFMDRFRAGSSGGGTPPPYMLAVIGQMDGAGNRLSNNDWTWDTVTWNNAPYFGFNAPGRPWQFGMDRLAHRNPPNPGAIDTIIFGDPASFVANNAYMPQYAQQWYRFNVTSAILEAIELGEDYISLLVFDGTLDHATPAGPNGGNARGAFGRRGGGSYFVSSRHPQGATYGPRLNFLVVGEVDDVPPPVFSWDIFNNGPGGTQYPNPNHSLAEAGLIRMRPQLDGADALVHYGAASTIVALDQDENCAMEFVHIGRVWSDADGWLDYFMAIDVNKNGDWEYINFYITVYGQTVQVLLVNALFEPPALPEFGWNIFNNGPGGTQYPRPNPGLAAAGTIRMWTQLDGVNAPVYFAAADTIAALDQDGENAMEFVTVNRMWVAGTGWVDYFNMVNVNKNGQWQYINLTITVYGETVHVLLVNALFEPPAEDVTVTFVVEAGAVGVYAATTTTIVVPAGEAIPASAIPSIQARTGFYFAGWYPSDPTGFVVTEDITFTARFNPLFAVPQIVSVSPNPAVVEQGGTVELVVTTLGMPDGAWVDLNVAWRPGLSIVGGPRFYIVDNQAIITVAAAENAPLGRDGFAVAARTSGDWGSVVIIGSHAVVIEVM